jgi:hypothetical protein
MHWNKGVCVTYLIGFEMFAQESSATGEHGITRGPQMEVHITYCCAVDFTQQIYYKTSRICFAIAVGLVQNDAVYVKKSV